MKPYSQDLRDRIMHTLESGQETQPAVAERFRVSPSCVAKVITDLRHNQRMHKGAIWGPSAHWRAG